MDRFVVREENPVALAGTRRRRPSEESTTDAPRSISSTRDRPTAKRSKPWPRLSVLGVHKEARSTTQGQAKTSIVGSGSSSSLLLDRLDERPVPGSERRLGNLNFRDGQRKTYENQCRDPRPGGGPRRPQASSEEGLAKEGGSLRGKVRNAGAAVAAATGVDGAVASESRVAFVAGQQGRGTQKGGVGAEQRVASDHGPTRAENERPALRAVRTTRPMPRSERVTDFFPRVDRGLNLGVRGGGRPLGSTTWTGRYPPQSQDDSNGGGSEAESGCSTSGVDVENDGGGSSRPDGWRHQSNLRIPNSDRWRGIVDYHNNGETSADVMVNGTGRPRDFRDSRVPSGGDGVASVALNPPTHGEEVSNNGVSMNRSVERETAAASGTAAGSAFAVAGPVQRSEAAERAAAAAQRRAAARGHDTAEENYRALPAETQAVHVEREAEIVAVALSTSSKVADGSGEGVAPSSARCDDVSPSDSAMVAAEGDVDLEDFEAIKAVQDELEPPSRCLRLGGMSALFLTQRRSTGGRVGGAGGGVGNAGRDAFRRQALSVMFRKGLTTMRLRMGRVAGSRVGAGVIRGTPEGEDGARRITGGVSCLAFDSIGALLAAGGAENVTVYDFDEYVPKIPRVKSTLQNGVRAYLQPTHCIQTRRAVSCLRWNPANEDQLAVSFLHYDDIDVFDLRTVLPNTHATPILSLVPGSAAPATAAGGSGSNRGRSGTFRDVSASGGGVATAASRAVGRNRGLGHLSLEFVSRRENGRDVTHLIAVGRGGAFRVWKFPRNMARCLAPYLQVQVGANPRSRASFAGCQPRPDVTAVCCLSADVALVGTDSGTLAAYSLRPPEVRAFQTGKVAHRLQQWSLGDSGVWRHAVPGGAGGGSGGVAHAEAFRIASLRPSPDHGPGVVVCGLRSGRVVVFDTRSGFALGVTQAGVPPTSAGYCDAGPYGGDWSKAVLACSKTPGGDEELLLLATSGRASLDRHRRDGGGRDSRPRPGPGWELEEAGGGGFRVQQCSGYGLCLPLDVKRANPGERKVVLSRDARAYLCSRDATGLLRSRMVTSSIMIGGQEHSIETVSGDGRELLLDRGYGGPRVGARRIATRELAEVDEASAGVDTDDNSGAVRLSNGLEVGEAVEDCRESNGIPERRRPTAPGERDETGSVDSTDFNPTHGHTDARRRAFNTIEYNDRSKHVASSSSGVGPAVGSRPAPGGPWRTGGVRIFAKLRAVFPDGGESLPASSVARGRLTCRLKSVSSLDVSGEEDGLDGDGDALSTDDEPPPPWSLLQVVGRAELGLPATAITSHPRMNFVLLGLADGTVAAVLPGGKAGKRAARKHS